jgi:hypothetical protein
MRPLSLQYDVRARDANDRGKPVTLTLKIFLQALKPDISGCTENKHP